MSRLIRSLAFILYTLAGPSPAHCQQPTFSASTLPNGTIGQYYSQNVSIVGGRAPFTIVVTGVPGGLATTANGNPADITGVPIQASAINLNGTPTQLGNNFPITILVTDSSNPVQQNAITY